LGFKTPKTAIEGSYVDKKCPFTGNVSIRGRILKAMVISNKMKRTLVVRRDYLQYFPKYRRFGKKHRNMSVHCSPAFPNVGEGDIVTVGQCRPLAKTVRFNVIEHFPAVNKVSFFFHSFFKLFNFICGNMYYVGFERQEDFPCFLNCFLCFSFIIVEYKLI
jgi:ribosomal protein uS17